MKKFKIFLLVISILIIVLAAVPFIYMQSGLAMRKAQVDERNNSVCTTTRRVFDYADVLTDRQERKLQNLIEKRQRQLGLDIVIVTMDEDVGSDPYNASYNMTIEFAKDFYRYCEFGWDGPTGSGIIYVDNWYDLNGYAESACLAHQGVSGNSFYNRAYNLYFDYHNLTELEQDVWEYSNTNPYQSYRRFVNHLAADMIGPNTIEAHLGTQYIIVPPFLIAIIFVLVNLGKKLGKKTTEKGTYVQGGHADLTAQRDVFLSKHTTQRHIETSSGGGGGGSSGGGGGGGGGFSGGGGRH